MVQQNNFDRSCFKRNRPIPVKQARGVHWEEEGVIEWPKARE
jgi:hypothetical protein